jgi:trk system potassium uptake protein TrkH
MKEKRFRPAQVLALSFMGAILLGTVLLSLPFSSGGDVSLIDRLFTSTSAVCVTGLIVKDTPVDFSPAGQVIILVLLQLGGLGIMTFSTFILFVAGRKISLRDRIVVQEGYHPGRLHDFRSLVRNIFLFAFGLELVGCLVLFVRFLRDFPPLRALGLAGFHSVSAFCNAGFSLFSRSLADYRGDAWVNVTVMLLIIMGGLGFLTLQEVWDRLSGWRQGRKPVFSLHSRVVLFTTLFMILAGALLFFALESGRLMKEMPPGEKVLASFFQSVTARTAGFNTVNLGALGGATVLVMIALMFVGASPGSTGGGVKTGTAAVVAAYIRSRLQSRESVGMFNRSVSMDIVCKAFTLIALSLGLVVFSSVVILAAQPELSLREVLFEVVSAFGTVGLSMGTTAKLSTLSKAVIILTMYCGRVGPLVLLYAFSRPKPRGRFEYVEEGVMIG